MYIKELEITNIRSIEEFKMSFETPAGWHVLIGDNGAGKSSIIRSIALALVGPNEIQGIKPNWNNWLSLNKREGEISLKILKESKIDQQTTKIEAPHKFSGIGKDFPVKIRFIKDKSGRVDLEEKAVSNARSSIWSSEKGWFSAGYGPFRRFTGGSSEMEDIFKNLRLTRLASHLSLFGEEVALTEVVNWLKILRLRTYEGKVSADFLENLKQFVNQKEFLPNGAKLIDIDSDGVLFKDGNNAKISVNQMSDGYRSILSLTFELLRQLTRVYGEDKVLKSLIDNEFIINLPGVVLIDEVDAHLHPTWQTRIGQWFTKYFPNIQFIVTSHSPLVCRAAENGSIWRLAAPGSDMPSGEIKGTDRDRLIFGNVLDAYGTEVFGENVSISKVADDKLSKLAELNIKSMISSLSDHEQMELQELKAIFPTEK